MPKKSKPIKFFPEHPCKVCDRMIPIVVDFCSSVCRRTYYNTAKGMKERAEELRNMEEKIRKQVGK